MAELRLRAKSGLLIRDCQIPQASGVNWNERMTAARAFIRDHRDHRWTFPNLRDSNGSIGRAYGVIGLPTTVILDSRGRIAELLAGPQTVDSIREAFNSTR